MLQYNSSSLSHENLYMLHVHLGAPRYKLHNKINNKTRNYTRLRHLIPNNLPLVEHLVRAILCNVCNIQYLNNSHLLYTLHRVNP